MKLQRTGLAGTLLRKCAGIFLDKYLLASAIFIVWVGFFDQNSLMTQISLSRTLSDLKMERTFIQDEIERTRQKKEDLSRNKEKYARERFYMKKPGEQVFVIEE